MFWPRGLSAENFLAEYWQRRPYFFTEALPADLPVLTGEELAWLATQEDVESRLITTERVNGETVYRVEHGPFEEQVLTGLPARDWTLMVQDVEKHLPDLRAWITAFDFVPSWRVDDLMVSFAARGGSAGPHVDNYDVFLCQTEGTRDWRLADRESPLRPQPSGTLALVEPFEDHSPIKAAARSVLYLPPGLPHWGVAANACMTYSIGMRAPTSAELHHTFDREFPNEVNPFRDDSRRFYTDGDLRAQECNGGQISARAASRCRSLIDDSRAADPRQLAITLGCTVTDVKAWLAPEPPNESERRAVPENPRRRLEVHGMARVAYWLDDAQLLLFANGYWLQLETALAAQVQSLCDERTIELCDIMSATECPLVNWLFDHGVIDWNIAAA